MVKSEILRMIEVSFIIPAFNAEKTIARSLKSIQNLSFDREKIEIILVDNNSSDSTKNIVKKFSEVRYVFEPRQGRSFARNHGIAISTGKYLAFLDADAYVQDDWLTEILKAFDDAKVGGAQGRIIPSDFAGKKSLNDFRLRQQEEATKGSFNLLLIKVPESPMINTAACVYWRDVFTTVGTFDEALERHEDIDFSRRVSEGGHCLKAMQDAVAFVGYDCGGWWSYFARSFDEGRTKVFYEMKWAGFSGDHEAYLKNKLKKNMVYFMDEVVVNLARAISKVDIYFFQKSINSIFKTVGMLYGMLQLRLLAVRKPGSTR